MPTHNTHLIEQVNILDLVQQDVPLKKAAATNGGEYAGPCPFCGEGRDRFRVWPNHPTGRGQYWCRRCERSGDAVTYVRTRDGLSFPEAMEVVTGQRTRQPAERPTPEPPPRTSTRDKPQQAKPKKEKKYAYQNEVARYTYHDEVGRPLFQARRIHQYNKAGERVGKAFPLYRHTDQGWQPGLEDTRRVIYRLPEIQAAIARDEVIFMVEGEKCVHALVDLGLEATTVPNGAGGWRDGFLESLAGAKVVIIPDNDDPGFEHARIMAADLFPHTEWVVFCDLPNMHPGEDVYDWLEAGYTVHDLFDYINTLDTWRPLPDFEPVKDLGDGLPDLSPAVPPLPEDNTGEWLDEYVAYAAKIAPMSPRAFHQSAALFILSTIVARRYAVKMDFGLIYPNLFIAWIADTSLWTKSTSLTIARDVIWEVAPHLLAPEETTHEAMLSDMAGYCPVNLRNPEPDMAHEYEMWLRERNFAAQRSILLDEMSGIMASARKDYNGGLMEAYMRFYDCTDIYRRSTRAQGRLTLRNTYLSIIGASTPASMAPYFAIPEFWHSGWWSRFAIITPEPDYPEWKDTLRNKRNPDYIVEKVRALYDRLPEPTWPEQPQTEVVPIAEDARRMWKIYSQAARHTALVADKKGIAEVDARLYGTYGRLPSMVLKVATLIAVIDWEPGDDMLRIERNHIARAIHIVEDWRVNMHRVVKEAIRTDYDRKRDRIMRQIHGAGPKGATVRDICQNARDLTPYQIEKVLDQMIIAGDIFSYDCKPIGGGRPSTKYLEVSRVESIGRDKAAMVLTLPPDLNPEGDEVLKLYREDLDKADSVAQLLGVPEARIPLPDEEPRPEPPTPKPKPRVTDKGILRPPARALAARPAGQGTPQAEAAPSPGTPEANAAPAPEAAPAPTQPEGGASASPPDARVKQTPPEQKATPSTAAQADKTTPVPETEANANPSNTEARQAAPEHKGTSNPAAQEVGTRANSAAKPGAEADRPDTEATQANAARAANPNPPEQAAAEQKTTPSTGPETKTGPEAKQPGSATKQAANPNPPDAGATQARPEQEAAPSTAAQEAARTDNAARTEAKIDPPDAGTTQANADQANGPASPPPSGPWATPTPARTPAPRLGPWASAPMLQGPPHAGTQAGSGDPDPDAEKPPKPVEQMTTAERLRWRKKRREGGSQRARDETEG